MEIKGTIVQVLPPQSGVSKAGNAWKKQEYILENNEGQFPRKICFTCFGQAADTIQLQVGQRIIASFDVESREYNGRWFTEARMWRAVPDETPVGGYQQPVAAAPVAPAGAPVPLPPAMTTNGAEDEFPF